MKTGNGFDFNPKALIVTILFFSILSVNIYFPIGHVYWGAAGVLATGLYYWMQGFKTSYMPPLLGFFITLFLLGVAVSHDGGTVPVVLGGVSILFFIWAILAFYLGG